MKVPTGRYNIQIRVVTLYISKILIHVIEAQVVVEALYFFFIQMTTIISSEFVIWIRRQTEVTGIARQKLKQWAEQIYYYHHSYYVRKIMIF